MDARSDESLLSGGPEEFEALTRRYSAPLYGYFMRCLGDAAASEDLFQETFLRVHQHRRDFTPGRPFRPWLYAIACNLMRDHLRRRKGREAWSLDRPMEDSDSGEGSTLGEVLADSAGTPLENLTHAEAVDRVRAAVADLPEELRITLILFQYQGLRYREISDTLGIPIGTVKSRLNAALAKIVRTLGAPTQK